MTRDQFNFIRDLALDEGKMAFVAGPRQVGKTTLARQIMGEYPQSRYGNWDQTEFRRTWQKTPSALAEFQDQKSPALLVLDEIHKASSWKRILKGIYDTSEENVRIMVTGSARLDVFQKGGDSLMGRYLFFRLHPLSLGEIAGRPTSSPRGFLQNLGDSGGRQEDLELLLRFSGFPEPLLRASPRQHLLWQRNRITQVIREDLRDLSRIPELSKIEVLASLLPTRIGSPLSVQSLREDLDVSHDTVSRWLQSLKSLYYVFDLRPYTHKLERSLKKEPKLYFYDWTEVKEAGPRFENLIAVQLLRLCHLWTDTGQGVFDLHYLRNKEKKEVDFLVTDSGKPWLSLECKLQNGLDKSFVAFQKVTLCPHIQIVLQPNVYRTLKGFPGPAFEISAHRLF